MPVNPQDIQDAISQGHYEEARELLREALKEPTAGVYYLAAQVALNEAQSEYFLEKALELDPFHLPAADQLAQIRNQTGLTVKNRPIAQEPPINTTITDGGIQKDNPSPKDQVASEATDNIKISPEYSVRAEVKTTSQILYNRKRLIPIATLGLLTGLALGFFTLLMFEADEGLIPFLIIPLVWFVIVVALLLQHRSSPHPSRRWLYQLEIGSMFAICGIVSAFIALFLYDDLVPMVIAISGMAWASFAIVGANYLVIAKPKNEGLKNLDL